MRNFKIGDKVRIKGNPRSLTVPKHTIGSIGTVIMIDPLTDDPYIRGDHFCHWFYEPSDIELIEQKDIINPENKTIMKPFDLELAKSGKPVITRNGLNARIICFDVNAHRNNDLHIISLIKHEPDIEYACYHYANGRVSASYEADFDLFMKAEQKEGWVNIYKSSIDNNINTCDGIFDTQESALQNQLISLDYISTIKVSWEQ